MAVVSQPGRALGVDLGSVRIGLALSDPTRTVASPYDVAVGFKIVGVNGNVDGVMLTV